MKAVLDTVSPKFVAFMLSFGEVSDIPKRWQWSNLLLSIPPLFADPRLV